MKKSKYWLAIGVGRNPEFAEGSVEPLHEFALRGRYKELDKAVEHGKVVAAMLGWDVVVLVGDGSMGTYRRIRPNGEVATAEGAWGRA